MNYLIIQLSAKEALFARFRKKGKDIVFVEASRDSVDSERPFASLMREITKGRVADEKVVLAIPPSLLYVREVELRLADRRKVREVLPLEMKGETALETDELVFDALPLSGGKYLAVWGKREEIAREISGMTGEGVEPEIVTASMFHWHALLPDGVGAAAVALTDGDGLAVYHGGAPVYFRPLGEGELATEVTRTLAALEISKGIRVDRVFLHGSAARQAGAAPPREADDEISFTALPVGGGLAATFPMGHDEARDLAGAYALVRACSSDEPVNFRRGELAYTAGWARARRKLRLTMSLAAAVVLLLFGEVGARYLLVARDLGSLNASIRSIYREVFPARKKPVDEVAELRTEIKRLSGAGAESSILSPLKKIAELKGDDVTGIYEAEIEGGQVRLKGDARTVQGANDFKTRASAVFPGAELGEVKSRPDGTVGFTFKATMKGGGQ